MLGTAATVSPHRSAASTLNRPKSAGSFYVTGMGDYVTVTGVGDPNRYDGYVIAGETRLEVDDLCHQCRCQVAGGQAPVVLKGGSEAVFAVELAASSRLGHAVGIEEEAVAWFQPYSDIGEGGFVQDTEQRTGSANRRWRLSSSSQQREEVTGARHVELPGRPTVAKAKESRRAKALDMFRQKDLVQDAESVGRQGGFLTAAARSV